MGKMLFHIILYKLTANSMRATTTSRIIESSREENGEAYQESYSLAVIQKFYVFYSQQSHIWVKGTAFRVDFVILSIFRLKI